MPIHRLVVPLAAALLAGGCKFEATLEKDALEANQNGAASARLIIKAEMGTELTVEGRAGGLPDVAFVTSGADGRNITIDSTGAMEIDLRVECVDVGMNQGAVRVSSGGVTRVLPFTVDCPTVNREGTIAYIEVYQGPPTYWAKYSPYGGLIEDYGPVRLPSLRLNEIDAAAQKLAERHPEVRDAANACEWFGCWHPEPYWTEETKGIVFSLWRRQTAFAVGYREGSAGSGVDHQAMIDIQGGGQIALAPELERSVVREGEAIQEVVYTLDGKEYLPGRLFKAHGAAPASARRGQALVIDLFGQDADTGADPPNEGGLERGHHIMFVSVDIPFDFGVEPDDAPWADTVRKMQERVQESCYPESIGESGSGSEACLGPPAETNDFNVYFETAKDYFPITSQWSHYAAEGAQGRPARLLLNGGDVPTETWMDWHDGVGDHIQRMFNLFSGWSQAKHHVVHAVCPGDSSVALFSTKGMGGGGGTINPHGTAVAVAYGDALSADEHELRAAYFAGESGILHTHAGQVAMSVGVFAHEVGHSAFRLSHAPPYGRIVEQFPDPLIRSVLVRDPDAPPFDRQWKLHFEAPDDYGPTIGYDRGWWFSAKRFRDRDSLSLSAGSPGLHDVMGGAHDVFISDIFYREAVLETIHRSQPPPYMRTNFAGNRRGCAAVSASTVSKRAAMDAAPRSLALIGYLGPDGTPELVSAAPSHMPPWGGDESGEFLLELTDPNGNVLHTEWITPLPLAEQMGGHQHDHGHEHYGHHGHGDHSHDVHDGAAGASGMWRARVPHPGQDGALVLREKGGSIALSVDELRRVLP